MLRTDKTSLMRLGSDRWLAEVRGRVLKLADEFADCGIHLRWRFQGKHVPRLGDQQERGSPYLSVQLLRVTRGRDSVFLSAQNQRRYLQPFQLAPKVKMTAGGKVA